MTNDECLMTKVRYGHSPMRKNLRQVRAYTENEALGELRYQESAERCGREVRPYTENEALGELRYQVRPYEEVSSFGFRVSG